MADNETARNLADIMMDALRNPHKPRPQGEHVLGELCRRYVDSVMCDSLVLLLFGLSSGCGGTVVQSRRRRT